MESEREDLLVFYRRYLQRCNEHRFHELGEFVADDVNGPTEGLSRYIAGLRAVVEAFPDYQWELQRLLVDGRGWLHACAGPAPTPAFSAESQQRGGSSARRSW
jgi:predicted ester cyclase